MSQLSATHPSVVAAVEDIKKKVNHRKVVDAVVYAIEHGMSLRLTIKRNTRGSVKFGVSFEDANGDG